MEEDNPNMNNGSEILFKEGSRDTGYNNQIAYSSKGYLNHPKAE